MSCIKSVQISLNATVFLVDNSANEAERNILKNTFADKPDVLLLFPHENLGFAAGVNLALKQAIKSGFTRFFVLNNDAVLLSGSGTALNNAFAKHPGSLIAPSIIYGKVINRGNYYHKYLGTITNKPFYFKKGFFFYLTGCALAFDKIVLEKIGFFDESFFFFGEDMEYSHRALKNNVPVILLNEKLVQHQGSKSAQIASLFYEYYLTRSHYLLIFRTFDNPIKQILALFGKSFILSARAFIRCFRFHSLIPLGALILAPFPLRIRPLPRSK